LLLIIVIEGPDVGKQLQLKPDSTYIIGRDLETCHLLLTDPQSSRQHADICVNNLGRAVISDLNSLNGIYVNDRLIEAATDLTPGVKVVIGDNVFELQSSVIEYEPLDDKQKVIDFYVSKHGSTRTHHISKTITIGRDPSNDVSLNHPHVSRFHATIEIGDQGSFLKDLNSTNGTFVDGVMVTKAHELRPDSIIWIGGYRFILSGSELLEYDETEGQVQIEVTDLSKVVTLPDGEERVILNDISFRIEPREFVAILGGSGSGKTTLLKALLGTWPANGGEIKINGRDYYDEYDAFKSIVGYVPQDDIVHADLTVEEVLNYAARLRMPDDTTEEEKTARVQEVMEILELTFRSSTLVKKLSGGQRKRVSIGVEILTKPSIMFLDEPTSGLDPGLEKLMMQMMRNMANRGQTIFCVTHATFNIHLCDKIIFLTEGGRLAFFGTPHEALEHFGTEDFAEIYRMISLDESPEEWQRRYLESDLAALYLPQSCPGPAVVHEIQQSRTRESSVIQWFTLSSRYFKVMARDKKNLLLLFAQPVVIALGMGLMMSPSVFEKSPYQPHELALTSEVEEITIAREMQAEPDFEMLLRNIEQQVKDKMDVEAKRMELVGERVQEEEERYQLLNMLVLVTVLTAIWFGASNSVTEVVKESSIYKRERGVNLRIAPYLLSKISVLSLLCIAQSFIYVAIISSLLKLPNFLLFVLAFFFVITASTMMGLTVSSLVSTASSATSMLPLLLMPQVILSGGLFPIADLEPEFVKSIFAIAIGKWGYELVGGQVLEVNKLVALDPLAQFDGSFGAHWWWLVGLTVLFYFVATVGLLRKDKDLA
jgi:ABC transport system ATP-binding/permease protein